MVRFQYAVIVVVLGMLLLAGCSKPVSQPTPVSENATPKDPEEEALNIVAIVYDNTARFTKKPPEGWSDLEGFTSKMDSTAAPKARAAIKKIQSLNYKMKWGVDLHRIISEDKKTEDYVIAESPDGRLKATYSGRIIKQEAKDEDQQIEGQKEAAPETESSEPVTPQ
ncbi:MAG: hypothetical protein KDA70_09485 [Planctomycetaceae bacterium]|nr:hypothetical protein [Planctomycetaceae bacterium]MCA9021723.1 hypothetical protein [Planctomycetaceae bacterium]